MKDGYPENEEIEAIEKWDCLHDAKGCFEYVGALWTYPDRFIKKDKKDEFIGDKLVIEYYFSTGGWSGNEDMINAMFRNQYLFFYHKRWETGGHWWFEIPKKDN